MPVIKLDYTNTVIKDTFVYNGAITGDPNTSPSFTFGGGGTYISLLDFNLGLIPNNAIINSAVLKLTTYVSAVNPIVMNVHTVLETWDTSTVRWNNKPKYDATVDATTPTPSTGNAGFTVDIKDTIQKIVNGQGFGIAIDSNDPTFATNVCSVEHTATGQRPTLTIDYTIPTTDKKQVEVVATNSAAPGATATVNVPLPNGITPGDELFSFVNMTSGTILSVPGWEVLASNVYNGSQKFSILRKKAVGNETSLDITFDVTNHQAIVVNQVFRNVKGFGLGAIKVNGSTSQTHIPNNTTSIPINSLFLVATGTYAPVTFTPTINFAEFIDFTGSSRTIQTQGTYVYNKSAYLGSDVSIQSNTQVGSGQYTLWLEPVTNEVPKIDGTDGFLGSLPTPLIKPYTVTDTESNTITITEKLNGNTIRQYTGTGAQTLNLTAQWASLPLGKHTVTIEANDDYNNPPHTPTVRTWTFLKILPDTATLTESVTGLHQVVPFLQSQKAILASALRSKNIMVNDTDRLEDMAKTLNSVPGSRVLSGVATSSSTSAAYEFLGTTSTVNFSCVTVTGLTFKPKRIVIKAQSFPNDGRITEYIPDLISSFQHEQVFMPYYSSSNATSAASYGFKADKNGLYVNNTSFVLPVQTASTVYEWTAYEQ